MDTYTIGQAAERSGISASALRYYEGIGLVAPTTRTDSGYRLYDDHDLARLSFISRAKQLGCSLEEITDLVEVWDGERCRPVQRRFHDLVTTKIADAEQQILELTGLITQLSIAAGQLAGPATDGSCGDGCACLTDATPMSTDDAPVPVVLTAKPDEIPIACTLDAGALPRRLDAWRAILDQATSRTAGPDGALRIEFASDVPLGTSPIW